MAEIMTLCNEMIFKLQKKVADISEDADAGDDTPAVCRSSGTCLGDRVKSTPTRKVFDRTTNLPTPPKPKSIRDPHLGRLYEKLTDLEGVGRTERLNTFMYIGNYMRILRPIAREKFDAPKKFVQRHTLVLNGPHPGLRNDLIVSNEKEPRTNQSEKVLADLTVKRSLITVKNLDLEWPRNEEGDAFTVKLPPGFRCDCLGIAPYRPRTSDVRKQVRKYSTKRDYCTGQIT